ncbi:MAG TPA: M67 family metallopeptidase [Armatimonadota bacterium]|jgi:proteasome lid subunit RPN8/RPN11
MIILPPDLEAELRAHGAEGYPYEIVGVFAGAYEKGGVKRVTRLFRGENQFRLAELQEGSSEGVGGAIGVEGSAANRYFMSGDEMRGIDAACRADGIDILGFYHTHPDHPSRPSPTDLRFAQQTLPGYSYAILSVENGVPALLTCWILSDDETAFEAEPIRPK